MGVRRDHDAQQRYRARHHAVPEEAGKGPGLAREPRPGHQARVEGVHRDVGVLLLPRVGVGGGVGGGLFLLLLLLLLSESPVQRVRPHDIHQLASGVALAPGVIHRSRRGVR